jgi:hypothetical protein
MANRNKEVVEGWKGPGRKDAIIDSLPPDEDGLHLDLGKRGRYEWWYFDAHLESGHTIVVFFHASNPNPGLEGKIGVEIVLLRPDGKRVQKFYASDPSQASAARDHAAVTIAGNTIRSTQQAGELPVYEILVKEPGIGCQLRFTAEVNGWKPGSGLSSFGSLGSFGWVIPFARASVQGTVTDGDQTIPVTGIGYHDHNWLNFSFPSVIQYWMWGRIYSSDHTAVYAYIQCNDRVDNHLVKVLMLADGRQVVLSTGEFDFLMSEFEYDPRAKYRFPRKISLRAPGALEAGLSVTRVLEAQDMLENFNPFLRFAARNILRIKPGYFRLISEVEIETVKDGREARERGTCLHEIVLFKPAD